MISVFNGRRRSLGSSSAAVFVQIDAEFRSHLHKFKGAKLAVFLAIALRANEDGWSWPSYQQISRDTGLDLHTIRIALAELCRMEIDGRRVLLRYQPTQENGRFGNNRYLIFPTPEEVARYESAGVDHRGDTGNGFGRGAKNAPRSPWCKKPTAVFPTTVFCTTKNNHDQEEPDHEEEPDGEDTEKVAEVLEQREAFPVQERDVWETILGELKYSLTRATFETWLLGSSLIRQEEKADGSKTLYVRVASPYARDWLSSRLREVVERVAARVCGCPVSVQFFYPDST